MANPFPRAHQVDATRVPAMLYGTAWKEDLTASLARLALESGFSGIDTASQRKHYYEAGVGEATSDVFAVGAISRGDVFLQTKFTFAVSHDERIPYDPKASFALQVRQSFDHSLHNLKTEYVDSYLLHGPSRPDRLGRPDWAVWREMEALHAERKTRLIGVSNISPQQLAELHHGAEIKPAFVQNRCRARNGWDREIRAFCRSNGMIYQGFSLLTANRDELGHAAVRRAVALSGKSLAQVVFRFALQLGIIPLTGTTSAAHMRDDLACFDFELEKSVVSTIEGIRERS